MEIKIDIIADSCTRCGKCAIVCPADVLVQDAKSHDISVVSIDTCISCGHCVAVCQTNSVAHSEFQNDKVHEIDYSKMPTSEQLMLLCRARRSNRAFSKKPVPQEKLDLIVEAAHRAPTASNMQGVEFTLVTNAAMVEQVIDYTMGEFSAMIGKISNPLIKYIVKKFIPSAYRYVALFKKIKEKREEGRDPILRGATAVLFIHSPKSSMFGETDCNLAYQNGSLMAESLGVSQVYTGFVCLAIRKDKDKKLAKMLGIEGTIHAGMALGMPMFKYPNYIDRKYIKINVIR